MSGGCATRGGEQGGKRLLTMHLKRVVLFTQQENKISSDLVRFEGLISTEIDQATAQEELMAPRTGIGVTG